MRTIKIVSSTMLLFVGIIASIASAQDPTVYVYRGTDTAMETPVGSGTSISTMANDYAGNGDVILITADQESIGKVSLMNSDTFTFASGTVTGGKGAYSTEVRTLSDTARTFLYKAGPADLTMKNIAFKDIVVTSDAHGLLVFNPTGSITWNLDNVTFDNLSGTEGSLGQIAYFDKTFTINALEGGYTVKNCIGTAAFYQLSNGGNGIILTGTGKGVFSGNTYDISAKKIEIKGGGTYEFGTGTTSNFDNTVITGSTVTYKENAGLVSKKGVTFTDAIVNMDPGSGIIATAGSITLSGATSVTMKAGSGISASGDLTINDTSVLTMNEPALDGVDTKTVTANKGTFTLNNSTNPIVIQSWASGAEVVYNKKGTNSATMTNTRWMNGTVNLEGGELALTGTAATKDSTMTLNSAAGTTFRLAAPSNIVLSAESNVSGALNIEQGSVTTNGAITPSSLSVAKEATFNTNGSAITAPNISLRGGEATFNVVGGTASVKGDDVNTRGTVTLNGGTLTTNITEKAPVIPASSTMSMPYSGSKLYLDFDASNTESMALSGANVQAINTINGGTAGNKSSSKVTALSNKYTAILFKNSNGGAAAPSQYPQLVTDEAGRQYMSFEDNTTGMFLCFPKSSTIQSVFWVVQDKLDDNGSRPYLLAEETNNTHFERGTINEDGTCSIFSTTSGVQTNIASGKATLTLNGTNVTDSTTAYMPTDDWSLISLTSDTAFTASTFSMQKSIASGLNSWDGYLGELMIFNEKLTDEQAAAMNSYLNTKWNLGKTLTYNGNDVSKFSDFVKHNPTYADYLVETPEVVDGYALEVASNSTFNTSGMATVGFTNIKINPEVALTLTLNPEDNTQFYSNLDVQGEIIFNGLLTTLGDYTQTGKMYLDFDGTERGVTYDAIDVAGLATLEDGAIFEIITTGFEITDGMTFDIMKAGEFNEDLNLMSLLFNSDVDGLTWNASLVESEEDMMLRLIAEIEAGPGPGPGPEPPPGPTPEPGNGVPEPSTWALLILGAFGLMYFRRKKN